MQKTETAKCSCGRRVELVSMWENTCPGCGQQFNGCGQALAPQEWTEYELAMGLDDAADLFAS